MAENGEPEEDAINLLLEDVSIAFSADTELESRVSTIERRLADDTSEKKNPRRREPKPSRRKRMVSVRVAVLLSVLAVAGTAFALTQTTLTTEFLEIFTTQYANTDFSIASFDTKPQGNNKLTIDITFDNSDAVNPHFANVTVNLINATGDEFLNLTLATGSVAASGSVALSFVFNQANVVPNYQDSQILVAQSS